MSYHIIEYMDNNPQATVRQVIKHFAEELEVDNQLLYLKDEVDKTLAIRDSLKPLYGKKMNLSAELALLESDFDMEVMMKYPPRKGTDKERKAYKVELQKGSEGYSKLETELASLKEEIETLEDDLSTVQQRAKNARRIMETFNHHLAYLTNAHASIGAAPPQTEMANANIF